MENLFNAVYKFILYNKEILMVFIMYKMIPTAWSYTERRCVLPRARPTVLLPGREIH